MIQKARKQIKNRHVRILGINPITKPQAEVPDNKSPLLGCACAIWCSAFWSRASLCARNPAQKPPDPARSQVSIVNESRPALRLARTLVLTAPKIQDKAEHETHLPDKEPSIVNVCEKRTIDCHRNARRLSRP